MSSNNIKHGREGESEGGDTHGGDCMLCQPSVTETCSFERIGVGGGGGECSMVVPLILLLARHLFNSIYTQLRHEVSSRRCSVCRVGWVVDADNQYMRHNLGVAHNKPPKYPLSLYTQPRMVAG